MERHRWLWAVGTALGLQLTIMPSTIAHISFFAAESLARYARCRPVSGFFK